VNVHRMDQGQMAVKLLELGVSTVSVQRQTKGTQTMESIQFDADSLVRRRGRCACILAELKEELHRQELV
jgi:hypothetical protein